MESLSSQAVAHYQAGKFDQADALAAQALNADPRNSELLHLRGMIAHFQGRLDQAVKFLQQALAIAPTESSYLNNLGIVLLAQGRPADAVAVLRHTIELYPNLAEAWSNLGNALNHQGAYAEAERLCREALRLRPGFADALNNLGNALAQQGRVDEAETCFREALRGNPALLDAHRNLGHILQEKGCFAEARHEYEAVLRVNPRDALTLFSLSLCKVYTTADGAKLARIEDLLLEEQLSPLERSFLNYAAGKFCDDIGLYDKAFHHYQRANILIRPSWDRAAHAARINRLMAAFPQGSFPPGGGTAATGPVPVFIVGMPRSGTSLVEQILASHPELHGGGELKDMEELVAWLSALPQVGIEYPECLSRLPPLYDQMAAWYLARRRADCGSARLVSDKMPTNFLHLGLIARMFPQARIIHCRRDPLDVCLSCFFQNFAHRPSYSYDLGDLGFFYRQYERLMDHWRAVLPLPILDVSYEELVQDLEGQTRRLLEFVGLPWDDRCLRFHETRRPVQTSSSWQVRQPLYRSAVGRWKHYARHLEPLQQALAGPVELPASPYSPNVLVVGPGGHTRAG